MNASEGAPKEKLEVLEAKASSTDEPSPSEAGKKEEVEKKDIPAVEKGKDEGQLDALSELALVVY